MLERVSPQVIVLDPPEKLVIETRASGGYRQFDWTKNGNEFTIAPGQPFSVTVQEFPNFFEIFVREPTTTNDLGVYEAELVVNTGAQAPEVDFAVTSYSKCMYETLCVLFEPIKVRSFSFTHLHLQSFHTASISYPAVHTPSDSWTRDYTASACTDYTRFISIGLFARCLSLIVTIFIHDLS